MRTLAITAAAALVVAASGAMPGRARSPGAVVGDSVPALWRYTDPDHVLVTWVLRPDHLVACETAAAELRELRRRFGTRMRLAIVSEATERETLIAFLNRQRLGDPQLQLLESGEFARLFGPLTSPRLYVMREGRVTAVVQADARALKNGGFRSELSTAVRQALIHPAAAGRLRGATDPVQREEAES